jgi:hypothetical protein
MREPPLRYETRRPIRGKIHPPVAPSFSNEILSTSTSSKSSNGDSKDSDLDGNGYIGPAVG